MAGSNVQPFRAITPLLLVCVGATLIACGASNGSSATETPLAPAATISATTQPTSTSPATSSASPAAAEQTPTDLAATPTTPALTATSGNIPPPPATQELIEVGPGAVDSWTRAIVRDSTDLVWIVAANNNQANAGSGPGELNIYRAANPGVPAGFDPPVATLTTTGTETISFSDAAIDAGDRLHVVWLDRGAAGQPVRYAVFDTSSLSWVGEPIDLDETGLSGFGGNQGQGGVSIALDAAGRVRVAYVATGGQQQVRVRTLSDGVWDEPVEPLRVDSAFVWHPAQAVGPDGAWYLAAYDATNQQILATSDMGSGWADAAVVASDVLGPENIDQGPVMLVTPDGTPLVSYLDAESFIRVSAGGADGWEDVPLGGAFFTHANGLGVLADGTLLIAGHDHHAPPHGLNLLRWTPAGWGEWLPFVEIPADGSEVFRWAGAHSALGVDYADLLFFDEDTNDDGAFDDQTLYYIAVPAQPELGHRKLPPPRPVAGLLAVRP